MRIRNLTVAGATAALALIVVTAGLQLASGSYASSWFEGALAIAAVVSSASVALLIGIRRPGHPIGLVLASAALALALAGATEAYGVYTLFANPGALPGGRAAVLWSDASWPLLFAGITALAFVFPDGRLPSPRWRGVAWGAAAAFAGVTVVSLFDPEPFEAPFDRVRSPLPELPGAAAPLQAVLLLGLLASMVAAAVAVVVRYRRAEGVERLQLLWLAYGAWLIPASLVACLVDFALGGIGALTFAFLAAAVIAVPVAVGIAVLRHRLYEIDRVVNRTLVYGALTACAAGLYVVVVVAVGALAGTGRSLAVSLLATVVVAVVVQPLRTVLQRRINRLMYGDRDDPYAGLSRLAEGLEASADPRATLATIAAAVTEALRLPYAEIQLPEQTGFVRAAAHGRAGRGDPVELGLGFRGETVGRLLVETRARGESFSATDQRLLADLARHAGAAVHAIRLTADLQRSRQRLVVAREEERRRVRRDLHDGLGPTLASAVFQVDAARDLIEPASRADAVLTELRSTLQDAVASIRSLVYALRPPALDELGLLPALREQATALTANGNGLRVTVEGPSQLPQLPAAVEVAAYRIAVEALTNAVRHSGASTCSVRITVDGGLDVEVTDDGIGCRPERVGVGIASMRERAGEMGAPLTIEQRPAGGTRVHTTLPLERE